MKLLQDGTYLCLFFLILFKPIACDETADAPGDRWTCTCSSAEQVSQSTVTASNCSGSCDCESSKGRSSDNSWTCICIHGRFPLVAADNNPNCFMACNCNSGSSFSVEAPREFISSKATVILLSICVVFALAFVVSVICYVRQKEKLQPSVFLSDEESSHNSGTNLIGHSPISLLEPKLSLCFPVKPTAGIINKVVLLFKSKSGSIHGTIIRFSYSDLEHATNRFSDSNLIGLGASSNVYQGHLKDGRTIAVKRIVTPSNYEADSVFLTEIKIISRLHHYHVVPLIGYSSETVGRHTERLLVFEFMANGNLRECLDASSGKSLDWKTRVAIALGAARGLEYLHEAAAPRILHRDVKSTNILLDENWRPKITDLGMAKQLRADGFTSCSSSPARMQGTFGYFAPEYAIVGKASLKSDVFSFGVVLLELITGRKPIYISATNREESLFTRNISNHAMKDLGDMERGCKEANTEGDTEERNKLPGGAWSRRSSIPSDMDSVCIMNNSLRKGNFSSSEYVRTLIHMTSSSKTCHVQHAEENVDLTEPRFESFCMHNADQSTQKLRICCES